MKTRILLASLLLALAGGAGAADAKHAHAHEHRPLHGGVVVELKDTDYELVAQPARIQLYVRDHGQAVDVSQFSARLTLLSGGDQQAVELRPAGDRLEATGSFKVGPGTKVVAQVQNAGKAAGALRFVLK